MRKVSRVILSLVFVFTCIVSIGNTTQEVKAATEKVITELNETVEIYPLNGNLVIKTEDTTLEKVSLDNGNTWSHLTAGTVTLTGEGTSIENKQILLSYSDGSELRYTLKELPIENDGFTISPSLTTINKGEYYTHYYTNTYPRNSLRLNHFLTIENGGVLQVNGVYQSAFSIGSNAEGNLQVNTGGIFLNSTTYSYHGYITDDNTINKATINVNGGLMKANVGYGFGGGMSTTFLSNSKANFEMLIQNNGKVDIDSSWFVLGQINISTQSLKVQSNIELIEGNLLISFAGSDFGVYESNAINGEVFAGIKIYPNQTIMLQGKSFSSYEDNFNQLRGVNRSNSATATSGIYYNWNGENGYSYDTEVIYNYGDTININGNEWDISILDTMQPGEYVIDAKDQSVFSAKLQANGYFTKDNIIYAKKVIVNKAIIVDKEDIVENILYGDNLELPSTVEVELNNGVKTDVPAVWNTSSFNNQKLGEQIVTGELTYPDYVDEESDKEVTAKITVKEVKLEVVGLPEEVYVGDVFTLTPTADTRVKGDGWEYDEDIFDVTFNSPATFTAKKAGETTITYTSEEGQVVKLSVVVLEKEEIDKPTPPTNPDKETTNGTDVKDTSSTTKTVESGDTTNRYLFLSLLVISFGVIIISKKKSKSN